jgi:hypothetical protein
VVPVPSIGLDELDAVASLRTRIDRKFLLDQRRLDVVLAAVLSTDGHDWRVLTVGRDQEFGYSTIYFDDDLRTFRDHLQGRRRRFKVRSRSYPGDGPVALEVKTKTGRGLTDKRRRPRPDQQPEFDRDEVAWIDEQLEAVGIGPTAATLAPSLTVAYRRTTLVAAATGERLTIDREVTVGSPDGSRDRVPVLPGSVIVEVKSDRARSSTTGVLQQHLHRPLPLSKYCLGIATLDRHLDRGMLRAAQRESTRTFGV